MLSRLTVGEIGYSADRSDYLWESNVDWEKIKKHTALFYERVCF
ncbi:hypothetical protein SAMN04487832_102240 [Ruminococcus sp. XPD3002]|nr:hypothetical protein SAMN04487832_102240 [Ruminococcus flavefaciens]